MADKNIGDLDRAPGVQDDSLIPVEQQGQAMAMTGKQFREFGEKSAEAYVQGAKDAAAEAKKSAEDAASSLAQIGTSVEDAAASATAAQEAQTAAERASADAESAKTAAEAARDGSSASERAAKSSEDKAALSETNAKASEDAAQLAAQQAAQDKAEADASKTAAQQAQAGAEAARDDARGYATTATEKAAEAAQSADVARQYSGNPAKPINGTWWIWNAGTQAYENTGIRSILAIVKSYPSVVAMEADLANMTEGDLVIIAADDTDPDNSKLYVHSGTAWVYLSDLSGLQGVGIAGIQRTSGDGAPGSTDTYTITLTDGSAYTFSVYNGRDGEGAGDVLGVAFRVTLPATGWADGARALEDPRFLAADRYVYQVSYATASRDEYLECGVWAEDVTADGRLIFHSETDPSADLTLNITRFELPSGTGAGYAQVFNAGGGGGGGGSLKLLSIEITTPPAKTVYKSGETFDTTGMVVTAHYHPGIDVEVTGYTVSPQTLTDGVEAATVSYTEGRTTRTALQPVTVIPVLASISVGTPPAKTAYQYLEAFDPAGMEVMAHYTDGSSKTVTDYTTAPDSFSTLGEQAVTVTYTEDGVTKSTQQPVTVSPIQLAVPAQSGTLTYTGAAQTPTWSNLDTGKTAVEAAPETEAGSYTATFTITAYGYTFPDGSTEATAPWSIQRATIEAVPAQDGALIADGTEKTPNWTGYDPVKMTIGGTLVGTAPGDYTATFTPTPNYRWADGTTETKEVTWTITEVLVTIPSQSGTLIYTGAAQSPVWTNFDQEHSAVSGETSGTNAGEYAAVFTLTAGVWSDGSKEPKRIPWSIGRASIEAVPAQSGTLTYNGSAQSPSWSDYDPEKMTLDVVAQTNAGDYTATFTPTANYQWADGATGAKTVPWSIQKAQGTITGVPATLALTAASPSQSFTVTATGTISAVSSADDVATVAVSGNTITVTGLKNGSVSVTVSGTETANYTKPTDQVCTVQVSFVNIFGVQWDTANQSTALTRLTTANDPNALVNTDITTSPVPAVGTGAGSSPFDAFLPWKGMEEYNVENSAITAKKGEAGFSRTGKDTVVKIPEFYFKITEAGGKRCFYIADQPTAGFEKHPGSGVYVGRYKTNNPADTLPPEPHSVSSRLPGVNITRATARLNAKNKGTGWQLYDFASWCAVWLLYLVEFADWNSQAKIGRGYVDGNSAAAKTGGTDAMVYHTGRAAGTDGKTQIQYRGIEDAWGNVFEWIDGINVTERRAWVCLDPSKYADDTTANYTDTGVYLPPSGWISGLAMSNTAPWACFLPISSGGGSETTFIPDYVTSYTGWRGVVVGGDWYNTGDAGLGYFNADYASSYAHAVIGSRLLFKDPQGDRGSQPPEG